MALGVPILKHFRVVCVCLEANRYILGQTTLSFTFLPRSELGLVTEAVV